MQVSINSMTATVKTPIDSNIYDDNNIAKNSTLLTTLKKQVSMQFQEF